MKWRGKKKLPKIVQAVAGVPPHLGHWTLLCGSGHREMRGHMGPSAMSDCLRVLWGQWKKLCARVCVHKKVRNQRSSWVFKWANRHLLWVYWCEGGGNKQCDLAFSRQNTKTLDVSKLQSTQWHNAMQLSRFLVWHHVPIGSALAHRVLVVPSCSSCPPHRKRQSSHSGNKDVLTEVGPCRMWTANIYTQNC